MNTLEQQLKKILKQKSNFSPRGSLCPICHREFRDEYSCKHSIDQVNTYLDNKILHLRMKIVSLS